MFNDILAEIAEGSDSGLNMFAAGKSKIEHDIAYLSSVNQSRMSRGADDHATLMNEHACLISSNTVVQSFERIAQASKTQLQMKCKVLDRLAKTIFNDPELFRLQEVEYHSLGKIHELEKKLNEKEANIQGALSNMRALEDAKKEAEGKIREYKQLSFKAEDKEKSLKEEIKMVQNEARREIKDMRNKLETATREKEKAMREWTDMKAKNSELEAELKKIKLTAEMAVKHKDVQEKSIFEMKGEMASLQSAMENIKISRKDDVEAFMKTQDSNLQKIGRLENEKELLAGKKTEAENLARSVSSSLKVTKNFSRPEVTSFIMETIFSMKPDGVIATELDGMFTVIAQDTSIDKSKIFDRILEYSDYMRDSPLSETKIKEAFSKISRYFRIMRDQNRDVFDAGQSDDVLNSPVEVPTQVEKAGSPSETHHRGSSASFRPASGRGRGSGKPEGRYKQSDLQEYFKRKYGH
jgi:hypothetical protein